MKPGTLFDARRLLHAVCIPWISVLLAHAGPALPVPVDMLVPGFKVEELPVRLSNQNNLRFAPDGSLTSLGYDGRIWRLRDTNGDGVEDTAELIWAKPGLSVPLGMAWSTDGLLVSSKGKVSMLRDTDQDGLLDAEEVIASGWPATDVGSGGVDATAVTLDGQGNIYFGLLVADYSNAYRLRKRAELSPSEVEWLKAEGRWRESRTPGSAEDRFSLYTPDSPRGTIQKWSPVTRSLSTVATGMRVPVALAFNTAGDLFNTDQEGETWMPNGNPLDELNHILPGRNYGFPPAHPEWLPDLVSEPPVVAFGPQHQSACGLVFNDPHPGSGSGPRGAPRPLATPAHPSQGLFGPAAWTGDAFVAGESRGRIWRTHLTRTPAGYVGTAQTIARVSMLVVDVAISPSGDLYFCCHGGAPDWGTGPQGQGRIFRIHYQDPQAPIPLSAYPASPNEVHVVFNQALHPDVVQNVIRTNAGIEFGDYVTAGDRFEKLKPPYSVVQQQDATPRGHLKILGARLHPDGHTLILRVESHPLLTRYAVTLPGIRPVKGPGLESTIDLDYDFTRSSQPIPGDLATISPGHWQEPVAWAPKARPSHGTQSREGTRPQGDWEHGHELFLGSQLQCAKCHRVRGEGGTAGPDLSNLVHRDPAGFLKDILDPGATIHPDYVTYQVNLTDGEQLQGFVRSQTPSGVQIFDAEGRDTTIPVSKISSMRPSDLSLMPSGLLAGSSTNDVRDLLTFLAWNPPRHSIDTVLPIASAPASPRAERGPGSTPPLRLTLVASAQDHGRDQHDYPAWQTNWTSMFSRLSPDVVAESAWEWPSAAQFQSARVMVFYFWNHHWSAERLSQLNSFVQRGGGVVLIHSAVIADDQPEALARLIGLSANPSRTGYRHTPFQLAFDDRTHEITRGFPQTVDLLDEPYWPLIGPPETVHVLASGSVDGKSHPLVWVRTQGRGRIFVSIPGHYTHTLKDPLFQWLLLRGIAWAADADPSRLERCLRAE